MRLCFLGDDPVVRDHARRLWERHDVVIVVPGRDEPVAGELTPDEAEREWFDIAIAGDWRSTARLFSIPAERYVRHVAQIEHRVLPLSSPDRIPAALALDLPLDFTA